MTTFLVVQEHKCMFQAGDILVVHYTDVGWSPYFPLIAGLVTEMGGLLSHGKTNKHRCLLNLLSLEPETRNLNIS